MFDSAIDKAIDFFANFTSEPLILIIILLIGLAFTSLIIAYKVIKLFAELKTKGST